MTARKREFRVELTPMIDVAFLMLVFFLCLPFRTLDARMQAYLPTRRGIEISPPRDEPLRVSVRVLGRDEQPRAWGDTTVPAPTRVLYRFADGRTTGDLHDVHRHILRMKREAEGNLGTRLVGEVHAGPRVQHKYTIAVLNKFKEARVGEVDFFGARRPSERARHAKQMPYPSSSSSR